MYTKCFNVNIYYKANKIVSDKSLSFYVTKIKQTVSHTERVIIKYIIWLFSDEPFGKQALILFCPVGESQCLSKLLRYLKYFCLVYNNIMYLYKIGLRIHDEPYIHDSINIVPVAHLKAWSWASDRFEDKNISCPFWNRFVDVFYLQQEIITLMNFHNSLQNLVTKMQ